MTRRLVAGALAGLATAGAASAQDRRGVRVAPPGTGVSAALDRRLIDAEAEIFRVRRPDDMLFLDIRLDNLAVQGGQGLTRLRPGQPGLLIVDHQPQAIAEEAYQQTVGQTIKVNRDGVAPTPSDPQAPPSEPSPVAPNVAQARISGPSRVVFAMPIGQNSVSFGGKSVLEGLLDACRTWPMVLEDTAAPSPPALAYQMGEADHALGLLQARLDHAESMLKASLPAGQRSSLVRAIDAAAAEIGPAIAAGARAGRPLTEPEIDFRIGDALARSLGAGRWRRTAAETLFYARRAVEAAAACDAILLAQAATTDESPTLAPLPRGRRPIRPIPATSPPPTVRAPAGPAGAARPPFRLPPLQPARIPPPFTRSPPPAQPAPLRPLPPMAQPPRAIPALQRPSPHRPSESATALEIPYRLFQSPLESAGWSHATAPVKHHGLTEIWHTRLGARRPWGVDDRSPEFLRAIWSWDYPDNAPQEVQPPYWALNGADRRMLVKLTAGYDEKLPAANMPTVVVPGADYTPRPAVTRRLMLTALGGWLDLEGQWPERPMNVDIQAWSHKTAQARDYFVRVVYAGFLFPFGHAASLVKVTERKFETQGDGARAAVLRQRFFIIVREPVRAYPGPGQAFAGRDFPFQSVEILTKVTADLTFPGGNDADRMPAAFYKAPNSGQDYWRTAFFPVSASGDFQFQMVGVDRAGRRIAFQAPLFFVSELHNNPGDIDQIAAFYAASPPGGPLRSQVGMGGAVIQFAPQTVGGDDKGDTNIPTDWLIFRGAKAQAALGARAAQFYPGVTKAQTPLPAIKHLLQSNQSPTVSFSAAYLNSGFAAGPGQVYLDIQSPVGLPVDSTHPTDKFGGLISPNFAPTALSRNYGLVSGDAGAFGSGNFDPTKFLPDSAMLLGFIPLKSLLHTAVVALAPGDSPGETPKFTNIDSPQQLDVVFSLRQEITQSPLELFAPGSPSVLSIQARTTLKRDGSPPASGVDASLTDFKINLFGFIILSFDSLSYHAAPGKKPDVGVNLNTDHGVMFGGPLEFVNTLRDVIPSNGFADPPGISVTPAGISASYSLGLPTIAVGAMSLQNVSLGAGFNLPFTGDAPSASFNFAERHNPFNLTISLFGGGGFVAISVDTGGVRELEAALEFGAQIAIDLGVASGGVYVKGGFYFHWVETPNPLVHFEGYVEMGGHLSVLCLITASLTFHLALAYEKAGSATRVFGQATLTVEIDILFFSTSVDVTVEKTFAGSSDPRFNQLITDQGVWNAYCDAFA